MLMQPEDEIRKEFTPDADLEDQAWIDPPPFVGMPASAVRRAESQFYEDLQRLSQSDDPLLARGTLGRYQLISQIGQGAMGTVYSAYDPLHKRSVAIKILRTEVSQNNELRRRFEREARLLAEIQSVHVTRLFEVAEIAGYYCVVQELVNGQTLAEFVKSQGPLSESKALEISIDVATALVEIHSRGIVHRDVKPENILLCDLKASAHKSGLMDSLAKLADFGIARHHETTESIALTSGESLLGTPLYMSPEQFYGGSGVDHRSDLYSLGATLFYAVTGQPPFQSDNTLALADAHRHSPIPDAQLLNKQLSDGLCAVISKSLQKREDLRYQSASELKDDLLRLQRGQATNIASHPLLPTGDVGRMTTFAFTWELSCTPEDLWPFVSNTERLNRALGLPAVAFSIRPTESGTRNRYATFRLAGMQMQWQEHMFEWVEVQRMSVLREFHKGPLKWLTSVVELHRRTDGGTTLTHTFKVNCRHLPGLLFVKFQMQAIIRRGLDRIYRRIDAVMKNSTATQMVVDAFEDTRFMTRRASLLMDKILEQLASRNLDKPTLVKVFEFARLASAQDVSRIRPRALAARLNLPEEAVIDVCLHGVEDGLFELSWDVICPLCRIATTSKDSISELQKHARCEACNFDFDLDFSTSVEMVLRLNPEIRDPVTGQFCIGGPAHSPHVVAQTRVAAGETLTVGLDLSEGRYLLRGPQLPFSVQILVTPSGQTHQLTVDLSKGIDTQATRELAVGRQLLIIVNPGATEILVRVERSLIPDDAITAVQAAQLPFFCRTFPHQVPSALQVASIQQMTFFVVARHDSADVTKQFGELRSCELMRDHLINVMDFTNRHRASYVRTLEEGALLAFRSPSAAIQAAISVFETVPKIENEAAWIPVVSIHRGSVLVTTLNGRLEYLGTSVRIAIALAESAMPGEVMISADLISLCETSEFSKVFHRLSVGTQVSLAGVSGQETTASRFIRT